MELDLNETMSNMRFDTVRLNEIEFSLVAERYGRRMKRVGANLYAECPWHDDKNPSLLIGGRKGNFCHCFSCGKSGSVIDYVMQVRNCGFKEACETLHRDFNIETLPKTLPKTLPSPPLKGGGGKQHSHPDGYAPHNGGAVRRTEGVCKGVCKEVSISYIPMEYLEKHLGGENSFFNCLRSIFTEEGVQWAINEYKLGTLPSPPMKGGDAIRTAAPFGGRGALFLTALVSSGNISFLYILNIPLCWWRVRRMPSSVPVTLRCCYGLR